MESQNETSKKFNANQNSAQVNFRQLLQSKFLSMKSKNSRYSLRAFAKFLGVDQSLLTKVLKGEKKFSSNVTERLSIRIGLAPSQLHLLIHGRNSNSFYQMEDKQFELLSNPLHFEILELTKTTAFKSDVVWMAQELGVHVEEIRAAVRRLESLEMIAISKGKINVLKKDNSWSNNLITTEARRSLQRSLAQKSLEAIDHVDFADRDHGSLTVAINRKRLPEFKAKLIQIRKELGAFLQNEPENLDEVYVLTMSLFPTNFNKKSNGRK